MAIETFLSVREMTGYRLKITVLFFGIMLNVMMFRSITIEMKIALLALSAFIILLGKVTTYLSYNPFVDIRIFSTRNKPDNWKATHQVYSDLRFLTSAILLLLVIVLKFEWALSIALILWVSIPLIYSIWIYPKHLM